MVRRQAADKVQELELSAASYTTVVTRSRPQFGNPGEELAC